MYASYIAGNLEQLQISFPCLLPWLNWDLMLRVWIGSDSLKTLWMSVNVRGLIDVEIGDCSSNCILKWTWYCASLNVKDMAFEGCMIIVSVYEVK